MTDQRFWILIILISFSGWERIKAQTPKFTMDDCMDYALAHEASSVNATLDEEIAKLRVKETAGLGLPQISGSVSVQHSPELTRFFSQYSSADGSGFGVDPDVAQQIGLQDGDVYGAENFFQLAANGDAKLSINQMIFDGSYIVGLQAAKTYKELSRKQAAYTKGELSAAVAKAYFGVLINQDRLKLYYSNLERLDTLYRQTVEQYKNGFVEEIEVSRLKVSLNNARTQKSNYENLAELSMKLLKFQMNYPLNEPLELDGSIEDVLNGSINNIPQEYDLANRHDYQAMLVNKELEELNLKNLYAGALPSISAFANFGLNTQSPDFGGVFSTNSGFDEVPGVGPDKWYGYSTVGLSLSWSIFTGLQRNYQIQQQKVSIQKLENEIDQFKYSVDIEVKQTGITLENSLRDLEIQQENLELAEDIFRISEIKYREGVGSNLEVVDAENELQQAQTNFYNSLYDAVIAKIDLVRAVGERD